MSKPRISVLIDTYNHERYIEQAIVSVLEQDFPREEMEIVVVDDGSTDNTPSIIKNFLPQLRYIRKTNGGQASAFNAAIPELRGPIVAFLDGDDWWAKQKLSVISETFEANPRIAAVGHGFYEVHDTEPAREMFVPAKTCLLDLSSVEAARLADAGLTLLGTSRLAVRREVLNRIGALPEELVFCADSPIVAFALALGGAVILDRPLCYYRQHSQNLFAPIALDGATERRKFEQLRFLFSYVPPRLAEFGVAPDVIDAFVESPRVEFERARLYCWRGRKARGISHGAPKISSLLSESKPRIQTIRVCSGGVCADPASAEFLSATPLVWPPQLRASPRCIRQSASQKCLLLFFNGLPVSTERLLQCRIEV